MSLVKYIFNPGINKETTSLLDENGWFDGNLVRFRKGLPEKIGGWEKANANSFIGKCRSLFPWTSLEGTSYLGLGTTSKLYVLEGDNYNDVTPIRETTSPGDVTFAAVNGDATLTVSDTGHGAVKGDFVTYSGAASLGGNITGTVLNQEYQIDTIVDSNSYTIEAKDTNGDPVLADGSDTGNGGSSTVGAYQINVGLDNYVSGTGWGVSPWGSGAWGSVSGLSSTNQLRLWSQDNFGEDLVANVRAGGIYYWDESNGTSTRAVNITSLSGANLAPTKGLQVLTSEVDRHVVVLGADPINDAGTARTGSIDPMLIAFSDQENIAEWEPQLTNTAGSLRLSSGSTIIGGIQSRQEILIWTDTALYSMQFIGAPFTFGVNLINQNVGLIGPNGAINAPDGVYWMARDGFYVYNGAVQRLSCSVLNYVIDDFNQSQSFKTFAFTNREFNEVGWFYCSGSSEEIDRYVTYNYLERTWSIGQLERHAWIDDGVFEKPRATGTVSSTNYLYNHEVGDDDDGSPMDNVFLESGDLDLQDGEQFSFLRRIIPDVSFFGSDANGGQINFVIKTRNFPGDSLSTSSTSVISSSTQQSFIRGRARQIVFRVESDDDAPAGNRMGFKWRLGATRLDIRPDGRR
jgi:hypothetical protein